MAKIDIECLIQHGYSEYISHGARSTAKVNTMHGGISYIFSSLLSVATGEEFTRSKNGWSSNNFEIASKQADGSGHEYAFDSGMAKKNLDIATRNLQTGVMADIEGKFPMSNISQNKNNSFENILGITATMNTASQAHYHTSLMFIPTSAPYFKSGHNFHHLEHLDPTAFIKKWANMLRYRPSCAPKAMGFVFFDIIPNDPSNPKTISRCFETGDCTIKLTSLDNSILTVLPSNMFINDLDGFLGTCVHAVTNYTQSGLNRLAAMDDLQTAYIKHNGADHWDSMTLQQQERKILSLYDAMC